MIVEKFQISDFKLIKKIKKLIGFGVWSWPVQRFSLVNGPRALHGGVYFTFLPHVDHLHQSDDERACQTVLQTESVQLWHHRKYNPHLLVPVGAVSAGGWAG